MSEQTMRRRVVRELRVLDAVAVENPAYPGTPDVNYVEGWIELKWARAWPKRQETPLALPHFSQQQRVWLKRRQRRGGKAWLLLQVQKCWMLFDGETAADFVGRVSRSDLVDRAARVWSDGLDGPGLVDYLIG